MAKVKKAYFCRQGGNESAKWIGKCPACGEWNTYVEEIIKKENKAPSANIARAGAAQPHSVAANGEST